MICIYVHALAATGVVRNVRLIAAYLAARDYDVRIVTALPGGEGVIGVRHHALLPRAYASRLWEKACAAAALHRYLGAARPAVLISAGNHGHFTVWAGSRGISEVKRVYRISNDIMRIVPGAPSTAIKRWGRCAMTRLIAHDAAHLALVSPSLADTPGFAKAACNGRLSIIANGIDAAHARQQAQGEAPHPWLHGPVPVVLAIGRLSRQKNFGTLLRAFALLRRERPARLVILGDSRDNTHARLMAQGRELGIANDLALPGTVANVFPWLAQCDTFILPSWWEGSANVLLEAMAVDAPCIAATSAGNAVELLDGGRYGLLVDPSDPQAMALAMAQQIDPATRIQPGDRIALFGLEAVSEGWRHLIGRLSIA